MGKEFLVCSDHKPLADLNIEARPDEDLGDLTLYLSQYNLEIKYYPGKFNQEADCLSRNPVLEPHENTDDFLKTVNLISLQDIKNDQKRNLEVTKRVDKLVTRDEIYLKKINKRDKISLTEDLSKKLIEDVHNLYCHIRQTQMIRKITPFYTAKNLVTNIKRLVKIVKSALKISHGENRNMD